MHDHLQVVHGHTHERISSAICPGRAAQIHAGAAVFEDALNVRFYLAGDDQFAPLPAALMPVLPALHTGYGVGAPGSA